MDEKIIKKNAVPVIAAMITALAFSFTGLPMDGNTSVEKMSDVYNGLGCTSLLAWILLLILYVKRSLPKHVPASFCISGSPPILSRIK